MLSSKRLQDAFRECYAVYREFFKQHNASYSLYLKVHRGRVYWAEFQIHSNPMQKGSKVFAVDISQPRLEDIYLFIGNAVMHFDTVRVLGRVA